MHNTLAISRASPVCTSRRAESVICSNNLREAQPERKVLIKTAVSHRNCHHDQNFRTYQPNEPLQEVESVVTTYLFKDKLDHVWGVWLYRFQKIQVTSPLREQCKTLVKIISVNILYGDVFTDEFCELAKGENKESTFIF